jgi:hypothetical protein
MNLHELNKQVKRSIPKNLQPLDIQKINVSIHVKNPQFEYCSPLFVYQILLYIIY